MSANQTGPKVGPKSPKERGNHAMSAVELSTYDYTTWVSNALRRITGGNAKTVARLTGSNIESAKNWLDERNAMNGRTLLQLMANDDEFCAEVLARIGRHEQAKRVRATAVLRQLEAILGDEE